MNKYVAKFVFAIAMTGISLALNYHAGRVIDKYIRELQAERANNNFVNHI